MARIFTLLFSVLLCAGPVQATGEEVVLGLSKDMVSINTNFDGSEILIFGAIKRESGIPEGPPLEVIVTVAGPSTPLTVRRKERRVGIWINSDYVEIDHAPSFYAVLSSGPLEDVLRNIDDLRYKVSVPRAIRSVGAPPNIKDATLFTEALIRIRRKSDLYQLREGAVDVEEETLFQTSVQLPAALTEGNYVTRVFLTRGGEVVSLYETAINVQKVGMERWLYELSREQSLIYGVMSLAIAIAAGWLASAAFSLLRP